MRAYMVWYMVYGQKLMSGPFHLGVCRSVNILLIFESRHCADDYLLAGKKPKQKTEKTEKTQPKRSRGEPRLTLESRDAEMPTLR